MNLIWHILVRLILGTIFLVTLSHANSQNLAPVESREVSNGKLADFHAKPSDQTYKALSEAQRLNLGFEFFFRKYGQNKDSLTPLEAVEYLDEVGLGNFTDEQRRLMAQETLSWVVSRDVPEKHALKLYRLAIAPTSVQPQPTASVACSLAQELTLEFQNYANGDTAPHADQTLVLRFKHAKDSYEKFKNIIAIAPNRNDMLNSHCPMQNLTVLQVVSSAEHALKDFAEKHPTEIEGRNTAGRGRGTRSWCNDSQIANIFTAELPLAKPGRPHYFSGTEGNCLIEGTLTKGHGQLYKFTMRAAPGEFKIAPIEFLANNSKNPVPDELLKLFKLNQGPKPDEVAKPAPNAPAVTVRALTAPATTASDGAIWSPFGDAKIFRSTGAAR